MSREFQMSTGCPTCGFLECVCGIIATHEEDCKFRRAVTCFVPIDCEHGYDVCPLCDPCTCKAFNCVPTRTQEDINALTKA